MKDDKKIKAGAGIALVVSGLTIPFLEHEDIAAIQRIVHGGFVQGEPPHTHNEILFPEGLLDRGAIVGSTATAAGTTYGFTGWTPRS